MVDTDVIVVGGGPTGLTAAIALRNLGHSVVLIDPADDKGEGSKALTLHAGSLVVLEQIGCIDEILREGRQMSGLQLRTPKVLLLDQKMDRLPGKYPFSVALPQPRTEAILRSRAIDVGVEFVVGVADKFADDESCVSVVLRDGTVKTAHYVVGADGKRSTTRTALDIGYPDTGANRGDEQTIALTDASLSGNVDWEHATGFPGMNGVLVILPMADGRARLVASLGPDDVAETREDFQRLVRQRARRDINVDDVAWTTTFHFSHHLADTFRRGRVLLAGDAAHVHSPIGGQGMNLGIRDGYYGAVAIHRALDAGEEGPLEAYASNRRAVASQVIDMTNNMSRMIFAPPPAQPIRNVLLRFINRTPVVRKQALALSGLRDTGPQ